MKIFALLGIPLTVISVSGCTPSNPAFLPEVTTYRSPADAHTGIRSVRPGTVLGGYTSRAVIEPENWRKRNAPPTGWRNQNVEPKAVPEPSS